MMRREFSISVIAVLLLSSSAFAAVGQAEGFSINAFNRVERFGLVGSAYGSNVAVVIQVQKAHDILSGTSAVQKETAVLTQSAGLAGRGGVAVNDQSACIGASQDQVADFDSSAQSQRLNASLNSFAGKFGGVGGGTSVQCFVGSQKQLEITPGGRSWSSQYVNTTQFNAVSGGPWSNAKVNNSLNVNLVQRSMVGGAP